MDSSGRKRRGGHQEDDRRRPARSRPAEDDAKATDDEVEEFFSILRRMRDATRSISTATATATATDDSRPTLLPAEGPRWNPTFVPEDFMGPGAAAEVDGARRHRAGSVRRPSEEALAAPLRLDLNEDPEQEGTAGTSPRDEATTRCVRAPG